MKNLKNVKEYSLQEFMEMELPDNSKLIDQKLRDNFVGPFSKRLRMLSATYNVHFSELEPAFRKLDLVLASGDKELVEAALRIDSVTIDNLIKNKAAEILLNPKEIVDRKDAYLLSNDDGWEISPNDEGDEGPEGGIFSRCHETVGNENDIWIPEFVEVFEQIDKMLIAARQMKGR